MKHWIIILVISLGLATPAEAQLAHIHGSRDLMFQSSLNGQSLAWRSESYNVILNKWSGELAIDIPIDHLYVKELNPDFEATGESKGKVFSMRAVIPINDVLEEGAEFQDVAVEGDILFNDEEYKTEFIFSVFKMFPNGFAVQAQGRFPHSAFGIKNLEDAEDEIVLVFSFSGE